MTQDAQPLHDAHQGDQEIQDVRGTQYAHQGDNPEWLFVHPCLSRGTNMRGTTQEGCPRAHLTRKKRALCCNAHAHVIAAHNACGNQSHGRM
jgi:hypothetical protein